jgi:hypothetical protein
MTAHGGLTVLSGSPSHSLPHSRLPESGVSLCARRDSNPRPSAPEAKPAEVSSDAPECIGNPSGAGSGGLGCAAESHVTQSGTQRAVQAEGFRSVDADFRDTIAELHRRRHGANGR